MATILAIEAASDFFSLAILHKGNVIERVAPAARSHSKLLYPMLNEIMAELEIKPNQLDAVSFVNGPGSFTGLRIAAATAQGIGFANDIPLLPVSTLQAMAQQAYAEFQANEVIPLMDARMQEIYVGHYKLDSNQLMQAACPDQIAPATINPDDLKFNTQEDVFACGMGLATLKDVLHENWTNIYQSSDDKQVLKAHSLLPLACHQLKNNIVSAADEVELVYLREQDHWKTIKQQKALKQQ